MKPLCPDRDTLARMADGRLTDRDLETVVSHVETCRRCQKVLDELTGPERLPTGLLLAGLRLDPAGPTAIAPAPTRSAAADGPLVDVPGFEVQSVLGKGGMGRVYKARHLKLNRVVALKMILTGGQADPTEVQRFRAEAAALARLQHPNIVQVFEVGDHPQGPYLVMEFCPGGTLAKRLGGNPLPPAEAAALVETLARAVHEAHGHNLVHRDLKPANVLLTATGQPKVTDFGLAKDLDTGSDLTHPDAILGTPSYMAPEQASGRARDVGPAADVWALGVILYECLTGHPPFKGATKLQTLELVRTREPVGPRQLTPAVPPDLETICLKCLRKDLRQRYASAADLADDLRRFRDRKPILARPVGRVEKAWKWARRNPVAAGLIGVVAGALVAVAALSLVAVLSERQRRVEAARADARRAAEQGRWPETIAAVQRIAAEGGTPDITDRFTVAIARYQMGDIAAARTDFEELRARPRDDLPGLDARVDLYLGELLLGKDEARARELIDRALARKAELTEAEQLYAAGLVTVSSLEALELFAAAEKADPLFQEARSFATYLSILYGDYDRAERLNERTQLLYPTRADGLLFRGILAAVRGDKGVLDRVRPVLAEQFSPGEADFILELWYVLPRIGPALDRYAGLGGPDPFADPRLMEVLVRHEGRRFPGAGEAIDLSLVGWKRSGDLGMPPSLRFTNLQIQLLVDLHGSERTGTDWFDAVGQDPTRLAELRTLTANNPQGLGLFLLGVVELTRGQRHLGLARPAPLLLSGLGKSPVDAEAQARLRAGSDHFTQAARSKSLIDVRRAALHGAILTAGLAGSPKRFANPDVGMQRRAAELIREGLVNGMLPTAQSKVYLLILERSQPTVPEAAELGKAVADRWVAAEPANLEALRGRVLACERAEDWVGVFRHGRPLVEAGTADADVTKAVEAARVRLKAELEAGPKKK